MHPISFIAGILAASVAPVLAAPASVAARATAGCGKTHLLAGITTYHGLTSSGRDRKYSVHLPSGYDKSKPYPVVLGFHGSSSIGLFFEVDTKLSESRFSANVGFSSLL
jgi:poly(3-hydroxybutyrate) depolymerase